MLIPCPHCGPRDVHEFYCLGDATPRRPDPTAPDAARRFFEYVYLRDNVRGEHRELFYHVAGCRAWLEVTRDTRTHEVHGAVDVRERVR